MTTHSNHSANNEQITLPTKEAGYDEFLAKQIAQGRKDYKNGRYITLEESKKEIEALLTQKERELQALESGFANG